jgi:hypothetical protein
MDTNRFSEDFGDEPSIEERMPLLYTEDGQAAHQEFLQMDRLPAIAPVAPNPGFATFLRSLDLV